MKGLLHAVASALMLACISQAAAEPSSRGDRPGDFDFYVLALSWSPSYCEAEGGDADPQQCRAAKPLGFVVHGLWPQFERGSPERCDTNQRDVPRALARSVSDLMPSTGLVRHEWQVHGTCSGLAQADYFALLRQARETIAIPPPFRNLQSARSLEPREAERLFLRANPGLEPEAVAVTCDRDLLREVRICLDKGLRFRTCPEVDRRSCRRRSVLMPPMSGN